MILLTAMYCNCTWSRTARLLTTNNPRYSDNDTFSAPSVVTFNGLFCNMSLIIYPFWRIGGGVRLPALSLKASTPRTYFAEGQRKPFKISPLLEKTFVFLYTTYTQCTALCLYNISNRNSLSFNHLSKVHWHFSTLPWFHEFQ